MKVMGRWPKVGISLLVGGTVLLAVYGATRAVDSDSSTSPARTTTAPPATTTANQTLPTLSLETMPVPSHYACSIGLYFLSSSNQATGVCVPYAYLPGGTALDPNNFTACPAGSFMTMGPVECSSETGLVTPVFPGPHNCSTPGGPCPSSNMPLPSRVLIISWSRLEYPTGKCSARYYFGEANGIATCVPYDYLPGGSAAYPNKNTTCPAGSGLKVAKLTGTLCTQYVAPHQIVAPNPTASSTRIVR